MPSSPLVLQYSANYDPSQSFFGTETTRFRLYRAKPFLPVSPFFILTHQQFVPVGSSGQTGADNALIFQRTPLGARSCRLCSLAFALTTLLLSPIYLLTESNFPPLGSRTTRRRRFTAFRKSSAGRLMTWTLVGRVFQCFQKAEETRKFLKASPFTAENLSCESAQPFRREQKNPAQATTASPYSFAGRLMT